MQTTRRDLLNSFATVGPMGALSLGMLQAGPAFAGAHKGTGKAPALASLYGKGPALEGPRSGGLDCSYNNFEQCRASQFGLGGSCVRNPFLSQCTRPVARRRR